MSFMVWLHGNDLFQSLHWEAFKNTKDNVHLIKMASVIALGKVQVQSFSPLRLRVKVSLKSHARDQNHDVLFEQCYNPNVEISF